MDGLKITNLTDWKLCGYFKNVPFFEKSVELRQQLMGVIPWIDAKVPGSVYADLMRAGIIEDPYFEQNSLKCEWVADRWWYYSIFFKYEKSDNQTELVFEGIDYKAHIILNGQDIGITQNMCTPYVYNVTENLLFDRENRLDVIIEHAPDEEGQIGYTSSTFTQKARFTYKWDFCTRLINLGIHKRVYLREYHSVKIKDVYFKPKVKNGKCSAILSIETEGFCELNVRLTDKGKTVFNKLILVNEDSVSVDIEFDGAKPWYTNGSGNQTLYDLTLVAQRDGRRCDERNLIVGFKEIELISNENSPPDSLGYTFLVNGTKIYVKGVNMVPLDMMYGCVQRKDYEKLILQLKRANINLIRVWGGGLIENCDFYELCDIHGILIWQEFIQSSSGIENVPSKRPEFLSELKRTAEAACKEKRNHVSLAVWSGGNELRDINDIPVTFEDENIALLREITLTLCPHIPMLPTSASGPQEMADINKLGKNHDVHGPWKYRGIEGHYTFFNKMDSLLHSEFGVGGMSCIGSLKKIFGPENLIMSDVSKNMVWRHHGEWWDTSMRDFEIFGEPPNLETMIGRSQFIQSEGIRYALEANRRRAFNNSGSIIWQANEPYPNFSNTCLIDYYGNAKRALGAVGKAYAALNVSLKYDKFIFEAGESFFAEVYVSYSGLSEKIEVEYSVCVDDKNLFFHKSKVIAGNEKAVLAGKISVKVRKGKVIKILLKADGNGHKYNNIIRLGIRQTDGFISDAIWQEA